MKYIPLRIQTDGLQTPEKIFNITHHQGNTNENAKMYHLTHVRMAKNKNIKKKKTGVDKDVEKRGPCAPFVRMQIGTACLENSMEFAQKCKSRTTL